MCKKSRGYWGWVYCSVGSRAPEARSRKPVGGGMRILLLDDKWLGDWGLSQDGHFGVGLRAGMTILRICENMEPRRHEAHEGPRSFQHVLFPHPAACSEAHCSEDERVCQG